MAESGFSIWRPQLLSHNKLILNINKPWDREVNHLANIHINQSPGISTQQYTVYVLNLHLIVIIS